MPLGFAGAFAAVALGFYLISPQINSLFTHTALSDLSSFEVRTPNMRYGFNLDEFYPDACTVGRNEFFAGILHKCLHDHKQVHELLHNTQHVFDARRLREGKSYMVLRGKSCRTPLYLLYEESQYAYVQYDLKNMCAERIHKPVETRLEVVTGVIEKGSSLYKSLVDAGVVAYQGVTSKMEKALAWSVDFHHLQEGDRYKLYYEKIYVDGKEVDAGELKAAHFYHRNKDYYAFRYTNGSVDGYYDEKGMAARKAFLKAPVEFSRISSRYNLQRYHPVLKRVRAHFGTDYAAPAGTPIIAVADGTVEAAAYTSGNGNYVKLKHDKSYQTQYLHMRAFAKGIRPGARVRQGDVIGYVGSTGLATGPHVCFRFWKDGRQVDHLRLDLPKSDPLPEKELPGFFVVRDSLMKALNQAPTDIASGAVGAVSASPSGKP